MLVKNEHVKLFRLIDALLPTVQHARHMMLSERAKYKMAASVPTLRYANLHTLFSFL